MVADHPKTVSHGKMMQLAEVFIPDDMAEVYDLAKKMYSEPTQIIIDCMQKA